MPGVRQGSQQPIPQVSRQAEIVDFESSKAKLDFESNSKPATQCLKLYDVRGKPNPFPLTKEYLLNEY